MKKFAVIVAGGSGTRMGGAVPKQFLLLQGKPVIWHTIKVFLQSYADMQIILVLPGEHIETTQQFLKDTEALSRIRLVSGGDTRFHSVQNGLKQVKASSVVFVHDGVRCLLSVNLIHRCYEQAIIKGNAIPAVAATDSIRIISGDKNQVANRQKVQLIQTPQTFLSEQLLPAFQQPWHAGFTDEATVVEASGQEIFLIEGEYDNIKITRPVDLLLAEKIIAQKSTL